MPPLDTIHVGMIIRPNITPAGLVGWTVRAGPAASNTPESVCTLEFASRVRNIEMGPASRNVSAAGAGAADKLLARAREAGLAVSSAT
jgi:hypothetical protein